MPFILRLDGLGIGPVWYKLNKRGRPFTPLGPFTHSTLHNVVVAGKCLYTSKSLLYCVAKSFTRSDMELIISSGITATARLGLSVRTVNYLLSTLAAGFFQKIASFSE